MIKPNVEVMVVASYGAGTNSKAMLIEMVRRNEKVHLILFADTGGEKPNTYSDIKEFSAWLISKGYPAITVCRESETLEDNCIRRNALPGIAYGFKSCSEHYKVRPQRRWIRAKYGLKALKAVKWIVGIDADESHRCKDEENVRYPLVEWNHGRDECIEIIEESGLNLPGKSACYFCPSMKKHEIRTLQRTNPELVERAIKMERNADLSNIKGLGRSFSWEQFLKNDTIDMFDEYESGIEVACGCYDG